MAKEIPILFSTPMVQAILEGRKTETRRIVTKDAPANEPDVTAEGLVHFRKGDNTQLFAGYKPKWTVGDLLWVRETFRYSNRPNPEVLTYQFKTGEKGIEIPDGLCYNIGDYDKYRPSIHLPKDAARIWLEVTGVAVERLKEITDVEAKSEGIAFYKDENGRYRYKDYMADAAGYGQYDNDYPTVGMPICSFSTLWQSINGVDSWDANPFVWVIKFKVLSTTGKPAHLCK